MMVTVTVQFSSFSVPTEQQMEKLNTKTKNYTDHVHDKLGNQASLVQENRDPPTATR